MTIAQLEALERGQSELESKRPTYRQVSMAEWASQVTE